MKAVKEKRMLDISINEENEGMVLEGYAVVFDSPSSETFRKMNGFTEVIDRHAFDNCDFSDCVLRYNHKDNQFSMARTRNKSLTLSVDNIGLLVRANLIETQNNRDAYLMVKSGLVNQMSFCFTIADEEWDYSKKIRRVLAIDKIFDVSIVDIPAYNDTEVIARNSEQERSNNNQKLELEKEKLLLLLSL